ncbi:MAG: peptidase S1 [Hyphomonadaceae bacterium]
MSPIARLLVAAAAMTTLAVGSAAAQNVNANPNYGTVNLSGGFSPDPYAVNLQSGGSINAQSAISGSCRGFISGAPDVRLNFSPGSLPLIISVASGSDTTLVVNAPDGRWYCDDDSGVNGLNPMVRFNAPMSGRYEIWVGTYGNASLQSAQLHISELYSQ